jgi:hypothetical protein
MPKLQLGSTNTVILISHQLILKQRTYLIYVQLCPKRHSVVAHSRTGLASSLSFHLSFRGPLLYKLLRMHTCAQTS